MKREVNEKTFFGSLSKLKRNLVASNISASSIFPSAFNQNEVTVSQ